MSIFLDRHRETSMLESRYRGEKAELLIIYGRRRIGKSELIDRFIAREKGIRLLAREESRTLQLRRFSLKLGEYFNDNFLKKTSFADWDSFFEYILQRSDERFVLSIDEFPYLVKEDPSLPSILQDYWDTHLKDSQIFLILSGSSISMMEESTMDHTSPLFGRRTGQILLQPLRFIHILDYLKDMQKAVEFYSVFGGTPAYIMSADPNSDISDNIEEKVLREDAFLFRDVDFVLRSELVEPRYYFSILFSIAQGNHTIGLICNDCGLSKSIVNKYLSILIDLHLIYRRIPVTEGNKSRRGLYFLSDNLFDFWFSFVHPNIESLERGNTRLIVDQFVRPRFSRYVGRHFEAMVMDLFDLFNEHHLLPFVYTRIGSWWYRGEEIDIVSMSEDPPSIFFCECKWQDSVDGKKLYAELVKKAGKVSWQNGKRREYYCIVAKTFSRRPEPDERVICYDLLDLEALASRLLES